MSGTLTANQKSLERPALLKVVLTKSGQTTRTYDISSTPNRIIGLQHIEQEWSQIAYIAVQSDSTLVALSLEGYTATISYGYNDATIGDEYVASAPLEVVAQKSDTDLSGSQVRITTFFTCAGVFDFMSADKASAEYHQEDTDTNTVKTLLTAIAQATLDCFTHCKAYTITFDSEDSLIDTYIPADYFQIGAGESRFSAFQKLIRTTKCKARIEDDGAIHIFDPVVSGTTYDYEYNDSATEHNFFEKGTRKRLVIPNRVIVKSHPDHTDQYDGKAIDTESYTALGRYIDETHYIRVISDFQCEDIAAAILQHLQIDAERGHGIVPMNCGQEVMDYVKFTDSVANDTRVGNVGYISRRYTPGKDFKVELRFGRLAAEMPFFSEAGAGGGFVTWEAWVELLRYIDQKDADILDFILGGGIDGAFLKPHTISPTALLEAMQPYMADITFPGDTHDWDTVSWQAGNIRFADGKSQAINAGSLDLPDNAPRWLYFVTGDAVLKNSTGFADVIASNKGIVALVQRASTTDQKALILPSSGKAPLLNSTVMVANMILAEHIKAGTITADKLAAVLAIFSDIMIGAKGANTHYPIEIKGTGTQGIYGYLNDVLQFAINVADGKIKAGGGSAILDESGFSVNHDVAGAQAYRSLYTIDAAVRVGEAGWFIIDGVDKRYGLNASYQPLFLSGVGGVECEFDGVGSLRPYLDTASCYGGLGTTSRRWRWLHWLAPVSTGTIAVGGEQQISVRGEGRMPVFWGGNDNYQFLKDYKTKVRASDSNCFIWNDGAAAQSIAWLMSG